MLAQVIFAQINEVLRWRRCWSRENLWMDMTAELLNPYLIKS